MQIRIYNRHMISQVRNIKLLAHRAHSISGMSCFFLNGYRAQKICSANEYIFEIHCAFRRLFYVSYTILLYIFILFSESMAVAWKINKIYCIYIDANIKRSNEMWFNWLYYSHTTAAANTLTSPKISSSSTFHKSNRFGGWLEPLLASSVIARAHRTFFHWRCFLRAFYLAICVILLFAFSLHSFSPSFYSFYYHHHKHYRMQ